MSLSISPSPLHTQRSALPHVNTDQWRQDNHTTQTDVQDVPTFKNSFLNAAPSFSLKNVDATPHAVNDSVYNLIPQLMPMHGKKEVSQEEAMEGAIDVMTSFYTQMFKMLFEEINKDKNNDEYQSNMVNDIFTEELAKVLGKNITSSHEKIASDMMRKNTVQPQDDAITPQNMAMGAQGASL